MAVVRPDVAFLGYRPAVVCPGMFSLRCPRYTSSSASQRWRSEYWWFLGCVTEILGQSFGDQRMIALTEWYPPSSPFLRENILARSPGGLWCLILRPSIRSSWYPSNTPGPGNLWALSLLTALDCEVGEGLRRSGKVKG